MVEINQNLLSQLYDKYKNLPLMINDERCWTFAEFFNEAHLLSNSLSIDPEKKFALCSENYEFLLLAMMAIWMRHGIAIPLNPNFPKIQKEDLLRKVKCKTTLSENYDLKDSKSLKIGEIPKLKPDAWSTIIFTSGSSGFPKAAVHTLENHFFSALGSNRMMELHPGDRWLLSLPLFHVSGLAIFFRSLISGASIVIPSKNKSLVHNIEKNQITHISLVSSQLQRILNESKDVNSLHKLKLVLLGGSIIPESLMENSSKHGLKLFTTYGSTEMSSQIATSAPIKTKIGWLAAGKVLPFREVRISKQNEIEIRGKTLFCGYLSESGLSKPFDNQGWFSSGDKGYLIKKNIMSNLQNIHLENKPKKPRLASKNDYLVVKGRMDSMFISGGENIHPEEIERELIQLPSTESVIVVPVEDSEYGQRPVAFIKSHNSASEDDLRNFLEKKLPSYKIPEIFLDWPKFADVGLKPSRKELTNTAQLYYDSFEKNRLGNNRDSFLIFSKWLKKFPIGWMQIAKYKGKQIFLVSDLRNNVKNQGLYVLAYSRAEVMEWMVAEENRAILDYNHVNNESIKWFKRDESNRNVARESFEIVRILSLELPKRKLFFYDASDRGLYNISSLNTGRLIGKASNKIIVPKNNYQYMYNFLKEFKSGWEWTFPEAVFQFGICLKEFKRMYMLRCLYKRVDNKKKFLGWKVQILKDFSKSEELKNPFWDISSAESDTLEKKILQLGLISANELQNANTPVREKNRRAEFQTQIDKIFN